MADYLITVQDKDDDELEVVTEVVPNADSIKQAFEVATVDYTTETGIRIYRIADGPKWVSFEEVTETRMRIEAEVEAEA